MKRLCSAILSLLWLVTFSHTSLAKEVTLKEKIGQMLMVGFKGAILNPNDAIVQSITKQHIGGVILFDYDSQTKTYDRNIENPQQLKQLTQQLQAYASKAAVNNQNHLMPLLVSIDYEGGKVNRLKEHYGFPNTLSAAEIALLTHEQIDHYARQMAETLKAEGINMNLAPVLDVNVNPDSSIVGKWGRSFSSDPQKVAEMAALFSKAYQDHGVLCAYKHFPGHGSSMGDTHAGFVDVTQTWKEYELEPYKQLLQQTYVCPAVMTSHVLHYGLDSKGYPASISFAITHELLREKLHFNGVVITDDLQMKAIADHYGLNDAVRLAINAGADILLFAGQSESSLLNPEQLVGMIYQDVMTGKIAEARIDEAYQHIMALKSKL